MQNELFPTKPRQRVRLVTSPDVTPVQEKEKDAAATTGEPMLNTAAPLAATIPEEEKTPWFRAFMVQPVREGWYELGLMGPDMIFHAGKTPQVWAWWNMEDKAFHAQDGKIYGIFTWAHVTWRGVKQPVGRQRRRVIIHVADSEVIRVRRRILA